MHDAAAAPHNPSLGNPPLASYLELGITHVDGWLSSTTASMLAQLLMTQTALGRRGDVCEIGVHHGRLFLVLANAIAAGERAVAVDVFGDQEKNIDRSGSGDRDVFERHLARYAPSADVEIIQESSLELGAGFLSRRFRFFSIDGGHTAAITASDLHIAERTLVGGGVAALDDILNHDWTGVLTGLAAYMRDGGTLVPFALVPNKLLLTTDETVAAQGRALMRHAFPLALSKAGLEFLGGTIDSYVEHPYYDRAAHAGLRREIDDLRRERAALADAASRIPEAELAALTNARAETARLRSSTSWRMTGPLRALASLAKRRHAR